MSQSEQSGPWRVQIVIDSDLEYFREVLLGVRHYGFETGRLEFVDRWLPHELPHLARLIKRDRVRGIVAALHTVKEEALFVGAGVPVVNISNSLRVPQLPVVTQDDVSVGRLAAEHLAKCGCRGFGFWGQAKASYSDERWEGFRRGLGSGSLVSREQARGGESPARMFARMRRWLEGIERPAGVFAVLDSYALMLLRAAREAGLKVPEDVAVLGAGNDDFQVEFERVPLSSIRLPSRRIGYEAGNVLSRMMASGVTIMESVRLPVGEIALRKSTDVQFIDDELVARAVRMIHDHPAARVAEVVRDSGVARSGLQLRFHRALGRGVLAEIQRVRLERVKTLLMTTELKLAVVAEQAGFASVQRLSACFRAEFGVSPGGWRRAVKGPAAAGGRPRSGPR